MNLHPKSNGKLSLSSLTLNFSHQHYTFRYLNDVEIEESEHFKISFKENEYLYRLDIEDCNNDHFGKIKIVAKNENGESEKEVR